MKRSKTMEDAGGGAGATARWALIAGLALGLAGVAPAQGTAPLPVSPVLPRSGIVQVYGASPEADPLGPGDLLDVEVFGEPQMSGEIRVGADGRIRPNFLPSLNVAGKTAGEVQGMLLEQYGHLLLHPLVSVRMLEINSRRITVTGAVPRPGVYGYSGQMTLLEALTMAGGLDPNRASPEVFLIRPASAGDGAKPGVDTILQTIDTTRLGQDPSLNRTLQPGDVIDVPEQKRVYITGDVLHPGQMPLRQGLTLGKAISIAGGILPQGSHGTVHILRRSSSGTGRVELSANFGDIQKNHRPDVPLRAGDIIVVPGSAVRISGLEVLDFLSGTGRWRLQQSLLNVLP